MSYKIKLPFGPPQFGEFEKKDFGEDHAGCDAFVYVNILFLENGETSYKIVAVDGREQKTLSASDMWGVWAMLGNSLAGHRDLDHDRNYACIHATDEARKIIHRNKEQR